MMPRQGTMIADRYRLERKVGGGRVSAMWRVQDQVTAGACAIKLLHRSMNDHPEALARFSLEDRLSRELTGAYFPERVGSGSWHSLRYIAWRWYDGDCLRSLFDRNPKQDVQTVYSIVQETCQALSAVHGAGYTHGDLKPENLFFAERGEADKETSRQLKLLGFGVASRVAKPLLGSQARRTPGQIVGTPLYLSPDLILGRVPRGGQADLWALSVIVYEALTGRAPFLGTDLSELLQVILERQAPRPSSVTDNLPGTFDLWWSQALEQQFATPSEFASSLARALGPALRSSRTQRSASLPDRSAPIIAPSAEMVALRPAIASSAPEAGAVRAAALTPAGGLAASPGTNASVNAWAKGSPIFPAASFPAASFPAASFPATSSSAASAAPNGTSAAPVGSVTALGVGSLAQQASKAPDATPPVAAKSSAAEAEPRATALSRNARTEAQPARTEAPAARTAVPPTVETPAVTAGAPAITPGVTPGVEATARAPGAPIPSTTVAGIGPTAVSVMRALETAAAGATAKIRVVAPRADAGSSSQQERDADKFAPLPSPLRDLGIGARKTLVGIIPPSAPPPSAAPASLAPAASNAPAQRKLGASLVISGTPCRSIDVSSENDSMDPPPSIAALRRLGSPTVPFPRPRAAPRGMPREEDSAADDPGRTTIPQSWQERTGQTLRVVLTDPDHRPHLVAGLVVCLAAALVIFVAGRSPVAGTSVLGQTTVSLTVEPTAAPPARAPEPRPRTASSDTSPTAPNHDTPAPRPSEVLQPEPSTELATGPTQVGEELAPGLILPPRPPLSGAGAAAGVRPDKPKAVVPSPSPLPPTRTEPLRPAAGADRGTTPPAAEGRPSAPASPVPQRAPPKKSGSEPNAPARPGNGDFDFGI
ncbi:MAG: protein kinase [Deltaproteobacteria bacterium]